MANKEKEFLVQIIEGMGEIQEKLDRIENKLNIISKTSEYTERAKKILEKRKILTKKQILEELGISGKSWRGWSEVSAELESDPKINVHKGIGRSETIVVHLNDLNSLVSLASRLFNSLGSGKDYNIQYVCKMFDVDDKQAKKIVLETSRIFVGRFKLGMGGIFKRKY